MSEFHASPTQDATPAGGKGGPIPGPEGAAVRESVRRYQADALSELSERHRVFGEVVSLRLGPFYTIFLFHPSHVRQVLVDRRERYTKDTGAYRLMRAVVGNGLITSDSPDWPQQRRLSGPGFGLTALRSFVPVANAVAQSLARRWRHKAPGAVNVHRAVGMAALEVVGRGLMSTGFTGERAEALRAAVECSARTAPQSPLLDWGPSDSGARARHRERHQAYLAAQEVLNSHMDTLIAERRAHPGPEDVLGLLLSARTEAGTGFSDLELRAQLKTLVVAGHETTASALSFTLYLLARHLAVQSRVRQEGRKVVSGAAPTLSELERMTYTQAVLSEAMRLYPPVPLLERRVAEADEMAGFTIPKGCMVVLSPWVTHRRADLWPEPERFMPERFLEQPAPYPTGAYLPFGLGPRACIGRSMALAELKSFVWHILREVNLSSASDSELETEIAVTLRPKSDALSLWVEPR